MADAKIHIHMTVPDLAASELFYKSFFGTAPVKTMPGYVKFLPDWNPVNLALAEGSASEAKNTIHHLGIQVGSSEEVRFHLARVQRAGLPTEEEVSVDCCYANQDKFWVMDPDGVRWEVYHLNYDIDEQGASTAFPSQTGSSLPMLHCCPAEPAGDCQL